ncbi:MAG: hypothetical protein NWQ37_05850 [Marivita lacus]|nr:hypothetical protein [Marivita lacus]
MVKDNGISKVLKVLESRVQSLEARLATELVMKQELRSRQVAITEQEQELGASLQERSVADPAAFRFGELRLHKLMDDQRRLQPVLAKAAIQRGHVQEQLKMALRQKLALSLRLEQLANDAATSEDDPLLVQFEMKKRL